jgi:hypothetical protein
VLKSNIKPLKHPVKFGILLEKADMLKSLLIFLITGGLAILSLRLVASPQMPDYIVYQKDTIATYNLLLERYLQLQKPDESGKLFGLSFRGGASFNCWRGYQAIYKIDNDSLFLTDIINCGERWSGKINKTASIEKMKAIFGNKLVNNRIYIDWFSNDISFPLSNKVLRWDGVFYTIYEKKK